MISAKQYNALLTVDAAHDLSLDMIAVHEELLGIINHFGLSDEFGVRLIHKHFDLVDGEAMVFRHVMVKDSCEAVIMGPLPISKAGVIEGKNFFIDVDSATLIPYEFTTKGGCDPSKYADFVHAVVQAVAGSEARNVFGLAAKPNQLVEPYTEFELPDAFRSTVMVPTRMMPADFDEDQRFTPTGRPSRT